MRITMQNQLIPLKDRWLALLLAWLVPGAGHFYQGRLFKGAVYSVCILGLFLTGLAMADWSTVNPPDFSQRFSDNKVLMLKYGAQMGVGAPGLWGIAQSRRFYSEDNHRLTSISSPMTSNFEGWYLPYGSKQNDFHSIIYKFDSADDDFKLKTPIEDGDKVPAAGTLELKPIQLASGPSIEAHFQGKINGEDFNGALGRVSIEKPVRSSSERLILVAVEDPQTQRYLGTLVASMPRPLWNHVCSPILSGEEHRMHGKYGNYLEIWSVCTWIAGLLNLLAMADAFYGPAYGYGDKPSTSNPNPPPPGPAPAT
ncbi:MAG: DUF6677 family protein [Planctomycetaceae bacterium]